MQAISKNSAGFDSSLKQSVSYVLILPSCYHFRWLFFHVNSRLWPTGQTQ